MKNNSWIFQAINFILLVNLFLGQHILLGFLLLSLWNLRIILLKDKKLIFQSLIFITFFSFIILRQEAKNKTTLRGEEELFLISLDKRSLKVDGNRLSFLGQVKNGKSNEKITARYYIQTEKEKERWLYSSLPNKVLLRGGLTKPDKNTNFNQFNYQNYLKRRKIHWQIDAEKIEEIVDRKKSSSFLQRIDDLSCKITHYIDKTFHEKIASYLKILFLADKSALEDQTKKAYRAMGIIHLFSISGFHISYLTRLIHRTLLRLGFSHESTNYILIVLLPFYALIAGMSVSVFRAVSQKILKVFANIFNQELDALDAWSITMILALLYNPYIIFELSFQLSYSLSGLFILLGKRKWIDDLSLLRQGFFYSLLTMLVSVPFLSYHFYEISWVSLLSNVIFAPFFSFFLFPSLLFLLFSSLLFSQTVLFLISNELIASLLMKMENIFTIVTREINFTFVMGRLPYFVLLLFIFLILYFLSRVEQGKIPSFYIFISIFLCLFWNKLSPIGYVLVLDVGQGDSILIKEPITRKITLIDTGGQVDYYEKEDWQKREKEFTIGEDVVVPALKSMGISTIDCLYISHAHADHMGEINNISKDLEIKELASNIVTLRDESVKNQLDGMNKIRVIEVKAHARLDYPTNHSWAIHPIKNYKDKNNQSLVLYVKIGEDNWLFTGDIEAEGEKDLVQTYPGLSANYLKVAHHGSSTSSTDKFIHTIQPSHAFISVAKKNRHNHPSPEIVESFLEKNIKSFTTAEDGAIKISYLKFPLTNKWLTKIERTNKN